MYVKGYGVDRAKIMQFLNSLDSNDGRMDRLVFKSLEYVDKQEHPICGGRTLNDRLSMNIVSFGDKACGDDLETLRKKELALTRYLNEATELLRSPEVFEFVAW